MSGIMLTPIDIDALEKEATEAKQNNLDSFVHEDLIGRRHEFVPQYALYLCEHTRNQAKEANCVLQPMVVPNDVRDSLFSEDNNES